MMKINYEVILEEENTILELLYQKGQSFIVSQKYDISIDSYLRIYAL